MSNDLVIALRIKLYLCVFSMLLAKSFQLFQGNLLFTFKCLTITDLISKLVVAERLQIQVKSRFISVYSASTTSS